MSIEGIPFIIRFKTDDKFSVWTQIISIEGIPFIIRFKTFLILSSITTTL